jgi:hypothetical protein
LLVISLCAAVAVSSIVDILRVRETAHWPTVSGIVSSATLRRDTVGVAVGRYRNSAARETRLHVSYNYCIESRCYTGRLYNILSPSTLEATQRVLASLPVGGTVQVHYAPDNPTVAVINTSVPGNRVLMLALALVVASATWLGTRRA